VDKGEWWDVPPPAPRASNGPPPGWPPDEHMAANWGLTACESPIEVHLGIALLTVQGFWEVVPQVPWRGWRMDFAIVRGPEILAFVECDGATFHRGVRAANDRRKNEAAAAAGIPLLRFTGSEIYADAQGCACVVHEAVKAAERKHAAAGATAPERAA
jgi:very-short-patch-repair endonuclease